MPAQTITPNAGDAGREETLMGLICSTCGRDASAPRIARIDDVIVEGCVDAAHEPHATTVAADYPAWLAQARAAGITGRP
jgi:hypothetical protein